MLISSWYKPIAICFSHFALQNYKKKMTRARARATFLNFFVIILRFDP